MVYGGQEYEMLATFVALTKSGHAYIPIDSHSALERVTAIVEVAEPSLIIAINDFPLEDVQAPILTLDQVTTAFESKTSYEVTHPVKGMILITSSLHQELQVSLKGSKFHTIISLVSLTG